MPPVARGFAFATAIGGYLGKTAYDEVKESIKKLSEIEKANWLLIQESKVKEFDFKQQLAEKDINFKQQLAEKDIKIKELETRLRKWW